MTNPNDAVGTNGAFGGRTSVNAFNDGIASYSRGVLSGWACVPDSGMQVAIGGDGATRDVAIAEDNAGNKTTINNISGAPIEVEISAAPSTNSRIDAIVAYVDNPPQGDSTEVDNFSACGLIVVDGTAASTPVAPDDTAIRTAITADGASGVTAYYAVIAYVTVANGTTDIDASMLAGGPDAEVNGANVAVSNYSSDEKAVGVWINGKTIYRQVVDTGLVNTSSVEPYNTGITVSKIIKAEGYWLNGGNNQMMVFGNTFCADGPVIQATRAYTSSNVVNLQFMQTGGSKPAKVQIVCAIYYTKS